MKIVLLALLSVSLCGCTVYREKFEKMNPDGSIAHRVRVSHFTWFASAEAAKLKTETQTEDFLRTVNADNLKSKPDAEAIKAAAQGVSEGIIKGIKASNGL